MDKSIDKAIKAVKEGKIIIYPTETCYGIGTNALNEESIKRIYEIKNRSKEKKMSCLVSSIEQAERYCELNEKERRICEKFMPGPLTLIAEKKNKIPGILNKDFAFRISSNEIARKIPEKSGVPLVSTSANISGEDNPYEIEEISNVLKEKIDFIVDIGRLEKTPPSTLLKIENGKIKIFREGPISQKDIEKELSLLKNE